MISIRSYAISGIHRLTYGLASLLIVCLPLTISVPAGADCVPPPDPGPGVHHPVGADAATYTYNCDTGLWENAHYTYDPATGETTPKGQVYIYNPGTGKYDSTNWVYDAPNGQFVAEPFSVFNPPAGATVIGGPTVISNTGPNSNNSINDNGGTSSGSSINGTGPNSNNTIDGTANNNTNANNTTDANVTNLITATANSGNATVIANTSGGSATSGNAQDQANVVNMLQSTSNAVDGDTITFVANIDGDVNGDLFLDPSVLGSVQPASGTVGNNNLTLNNSVDASINNTIDLTANSGDATVSGNTSGGDATSGTAQTIANVINLINSAVMSGKSFVGTININGNLNGDILIPDNFVDQLIAANVPTVTITQTGPGSNNTINTNNGSNNTKVTNTNNQDITNNVNANATSGTANVSNNTSGGDATTGEASNSITAFNLTGSYVTGCNAILVFVNVSGSWVGLIVKAPPGATAAALGSCVSNTGPGNNNTDITSNSNLSITNNINSNANSGDADVTGNTKGGNAKSGNAKNAVNLLNVQNSALSFRGWFGILFINVFGTWHGSFGINTAAGNKPFSPTPGAVGGGFATFVPTPAGGSSGGNTPTNNFVPSASISNTGPGSNNSVVLAANKIVAKGQNKSAPADQVNWLWATLGSIAFILFIVGDRLYAILPSVRRQS